MENHRYASRGWMALEQTRQIVAPDPSHGNLEHHHIRLETDHISSRTDGGSALADAVTGGLKPGLGPAQRRDAVVDQKNVQLS